MLAYQAWNHCGVLYHDLADNRSAIRCLRVMNALTELHIVRLLDDHVQVIQHAVRTDSRPIVRNFALLSAQKLVSGASLASPDAFGSLIECVVDQLCETTAPLKTKCLALCAVEGWCRELALDARTRDRVANEAVQMHTLHPDRVGRASVNYLATIARRALVVQGGEPAWSPSQPPPGLELLMELLRPECFDQSAVAYGRSLESVERLCLAFPEDLSPYVVGCLIELLTLATGASVGELKRRIVTTLSHIAFANSTSVAAHVHVLLHSLSSLSADESSSRAALAVTLFRALRTSASGDNSESVDDLERLFTDAKYATQADRYEIAKLAMTHGYFRLALILTTSVAEASDSECFGGWLRALSAISDAEASVVRDGRVGLDSIYQLSRAAAFVSTASTPHFKFAFQLHVVALRTEWMKLVLQAQQFAGETEYGNVKGGAREATLCDRFHSTATQYHLLRSTLLGADASTLDALDGAARVCELLAVAVDGLLLLHTPPLASQPPRFITSKSLSFVQQTCEALEADILERVGVLQRVDSSRRASVGGKVMLQLLQTVCTTPLGLPPHFFRTTVKSPQRRIASNVQFLTAAENTAFTSKPRPRSQLGVPFGTDFNSLLKGVVEVSASALGYWRDKIHTLNVEVHVSQADKAGAASATVASDHDVIRERIVLDWTEAVSQTRGRGEDGDDSGGQETSVFLAFETAVHVNAATLRTKGSFQLRAVVSVIDKAGEAWQLAATGCTRGFIVY